MNPGRILCNGQTSRCLKTSQSISLPLVLIPICIMMLAACVYTTPDVRISAPKVYTDDQVLKTFAERRRVLSKKAAGIT